MTVTMMMNREVQDHWGCSDPCLLLLGHLDQIGSYTYLLRSCRSKYQAHLSPILDPMITGDSYAFFGLYPRLEVIRPPHGQHAVRDPICSSLGI
ncbi:hypothetical protein AHF37_12170 [Paragonimus kellicotti]|nr:hypothetical protein AHF37_12170 [Paragonimus kellicotti]